MDIIPTLSWYWVLKKTFHTKPGLGIKVIYEVTFSFTPFPPSFCGIRKARKFY
jgi:hypothetical protein